MPNDVPRRVEEIEGRIGIERIGACQVNLARDHLAASRAAGIRPEEEELEVGHELVIVERLPGPQPRAAKEVTARHLQYRPLQQVPV